MKSIFEQRLGFSANLTELSKTICRNFNLGNLIEYKPILIGYDDFNFSIKTKTNKFLVKIFSKEKTLDNCKRNIKIIARALEKGVSVPKLHKSKQGYLHIIKTADGLLRFCVMDFIEAEDLFTSKTSISKEDMLMIAYQASLINSIDTKPPKIYDTWAITNFPLEFKKKYKYLEKHDLELITPLLETFKKLSIKKLPHCFVHGDIIRTNVIKDKNGKIWIIDFSVSNYYPRIQELAILACDILFTKDKKKRKQNLRVALEEYQKIIKLTQTELASLPNYIKIAHAMFVLCATYEKKVNNNNTKENKYFLSLGKTGLRQ
ncbi:MAG: phosphotransferase [Candidatus Aenigmatarchaeota archaeon]